MISWQLKRLPGGMNAGDRAQGGGVPARVFLFLLLAHFTCGHTYLLFSVGRGLRQLRPENKKCRRNNPTAFKINIYLGDLTPRRSLRPSCNT